MSKDIKKLCIDIYEAIYKIVGELNKRYTVEMYYKFNDIEKKNEIYELKKGINQYGTCTSWGIIENCEEISMTLNTEDSSCVKSYEEKSDKLEHGIKEQEVNSITHKKYLEEYSVVTVLKISNIDLDTMKTYNEKTNLSFIKLLLDYMSFSDNYEVVLKMNEKEVLRKASQLYVEKIKNIALNGYRREELIDYKELNQKDILNISSLIESIDDISNSVYESKNPFGNIVLLNEKDNSGIKYILKFKDNENPIKLTDTKRVRKLLEITKENEDLAIITNGEDIFGIGEINIIKMQNMIIFKIAFKGIAKYEIKALNAKLTNEFKVIKEEKEKYYDVRHKIIESNLLKINFKIPQVNEKIYNIQRVKNILEEVFYNNNDSISNIKEKALNSLVGVINRACNQKYGTIVVITNESVARSEVERLKKQSTCIEESEINEKYINYITSIDGAIYFDEYGKCHAIGVILDGQASQDVGDASRGARYNSAHKYFTQLHKNKQESVIIIVSEDGMIDIVSRVMNEDEILKYSENLRQKLKEDKIRVETAIKLIEEFKNDIKILNQDIMFTIADICMEQGKNEKKETTLEEKKGFFEIAEKYYSEAINKNDINYKRITANQYNCYALSLEVLRKYKYAMEYFQKAIDSSMDEIERLVYEFNLGNIYLNYGNSIDKQEKIEADNYFRKSIEKFTNLIDNGLDGVENQRKLLILDRLKSERGLAYEKIGKYDEAAKDYIELLLDLKSKLYSKESITEKISLIANKIDKKKIYEYFTERIAEIGKDKNEFQDVEILLQNINNSDEIK
ncbi:hypothetical protein LF65_04738 [Clostridium beijerinckii]|uniref:DAC domain-containing protein n=1 Tax=Clostridium beijerinckii TaxID=1520 RepID=A0A0B5QT99_CLOBE|nr:diadenylate cyclase [Clostridium beijerinckii]AJH01268.1 hypothetical protein LF65_04738 [Clostridium beijerinckii]